MLKDRFGRSIEYLRISVTDRCNLECSYCFSGQKELLDKAGILSYEEILKVIDVAADELDIKNYRLTGGEPLTRKNLSHLISEIIRRNLSLGLTTNGILLEKYAVELHDAGLKHINISLDTLSPSIFKANTGGNISAVLNGIEKSHSLGFSPIKVNIVVVENIVDTAVEFINWSKKMDITLKFIEKMPFGSGAKSDFNFIDFEQTLIKKFELLPTLIPAFGPGRYYQSNKIKLGFVSSLSHPFCRNCNRLRLTCDGKLIPCLGHSFHVDIKGILRTTLDKESKTSLIKKAFKEVVWRKPENHDNFVNASKSMAAIGG